MSDSPHLRPADADRGSTPPCEPQANEADTPLDGAELSRGELAQAQAYHRQGLICDLTDTALDLAFLTVMTVWLAQPLDGWLESAAGLHHYWLRLISFYAISYALHLTLSFPLSVYSGHVLEHRYGLSRQSFRGWFWRFAKRNVLGLVFGGLTMLGLFFMLNIAGSWWWLWSAGAFFVVGVLLAQLAPVLLIPMFHRVERLDDPDLARRFGELADGTGLRLEGLYRLELSGETEKANAMLAGLGRTRRVLLSDTLLHSFTTDEIAVVLAHEIGHHVYRHIPKLMFVSLLYGVAGFWLADRALAAYLANVGQTLDYGTVPVFALSLLSLAITLFSLVLAPLQNGLMRRFERQCDRFALARTGLRDAYRSAFLKLARQNKEDPQPHWLEVLLLHDHPPIHERLAVASEIE